MGQRGDVETERTRGGHGGVRRGRERTRCGNAAGRSNVRRSAGGSRRCSVELSEAESSSDCYFVFPVGDESIGPFAEILTLFF